MPRLECDSRARNLFSLGFAFKILKQSCLAFTRAESRNLIIAQGSALGLITPKTLALKRQSQKCAAWKAPSGRQIIAITFTQGAARALSWFELSAREPKLFPLRLSVMPKKSRQGPARRLSPSIPNFECSPRRIKFRQKFVV
jgi:hypothetical protein